MLVPDLPGHGVSEPLPEHVEGLADLRAPRRAGRRARRDAARRARRLLAWAASSRSGSRSAARGRDGARADRLGRHRLDRRRRAEIWLAVTGGSPPGPGDDTLPRRLRAPAAASLAALRLLGRGGSARRSTPEAVIGFLEGPPQHTDVRQRGAARSSRDDPRARSRPRPLPGTRGLGRARPPRAARGRLRVRAPAAGAAPRSSRPPATSSSASGPTRAPRSSWKVPRPGSGGRRSPSRARSARRAAPRAPGRRASRSRSGRRRRNGCRPPSPRASSARPASPVTKQS